MRFFISILTVFCLTGSVEAQDSGLAFHNFNRSYLDSTGIYRVDPGKNQQVAAIWTQAIYWDMAMTAYSKSKDKSSKDLMDKIYQGNYKHYDGFNWNNTDVWFIYDDIMWWVISFARGYQLTEDPTYLAHAILGFDRVWSGTPKLADKGSFDPQRGGMYWGWKPDQRGKTACINYPAVVAAMLLYDSTKDDQYLQKAKQVYDWSYQNLFDQSLGKVGDHQVPGQKTNWTINLYNQATCIGAAVLLFEQSKDQKYLEHAKLCADYVMNTMADEQGILPFKNGIEQGIYTAIFAQYIQQLFPYDEGGTYRKWIKKNTDLAWKNRDENGLMGKDFHHKSPVKNEVYDASAAVALLQILD